MLYNNYDKDLCLKNHEKVVLFLTKSKNYVMKVIFFNSLYLQYQLHCLSSKPTLLNFLPPVCIRILKFASFELQRTSLQENKPSSSALFRDHFETSVNRKKTKKNLYFGKDVREGKNLMHCVLYFIPLRLYDKGIDFPTLLKCDNL